MVTSRRDGGRTPLSPEDVRRIRLSLGLSQAEAGELLGGGPRAFTKYENGNIKPSASVSNLLRLLDAKPEAASTLLGRNLAPMADQSLGPLKVGGQHVAALNERKLVLLVRKLLNAEALSAGIGMDRLRVSSNVTEPDGGEDGRIEWSGGPERTRFLPSRLNQFQMKATEISPAEAGEEVIDAAGRVKTMVADVLSRGGTYVMMCGRRYTTKKVEMRSAALRKRLSQAGLHVPQSQLQFRDADQIADWINTHPAVAAWVLQETQPGLVGPFRDWTHWAGRHEHDSSPLIHDDRLEAFQKSLRRLVVPERGVARVVGLSGRGKSRLTLEALAPTPDEDESNVRLCDLVLYAVEAEAGAETIKTIVQGLADSGLRAIIVVDRCPQDSHRDLAAMVMRSGSRLSLVTIDHDAPQGRPLPEDTLLVGEAPKAVIEGMLQRNAPRASDADFPRLVRLASGFPQLARLIGDAWLQDVGIASASDTVLFNRILLGRDRDDAALIENSAMLLSTFGLVGIKAPLDQVNELARFSAGHSAGQVRSAIDDLVSRGVAQVRGRLVALQPRPLALHLAEKQWRRWDSSTWDEVLFGPVDPKLRIQASEQLAMLNDRPISSLVAQRVCRYDGPIASIEALCSDGNAEVISSLAEVDAEVVVSLLERHLSSASLEVLREVSGDARRHLVEALAKVAFVSDTFERGASLMFKLAQAENESWGNNASGMFKALFPVYLGNTEAGFEDRIRVIDDVLKSSGVECQDLALSALLAGAKADGFSRAVGVEIHGVRPALKPWMPSGPGEARQYVRECGSRLAKLALAPDERGERARSELAGLFRSYIAAGLLDDVERWVREVSVTYSYWPEALTTLGDVLQYDIADHPEADVRRVQGLVAELRPSDIASKVRFLITDMPWDYPIDEKLGFEDRRKRQAEVIDELASELLGNTQQLLAFFPSLSVGNQRMSVEFGRVIASKADDALALRKPIIDALLMAPAENRNFGLLVGFMWGLAEREPDAFEEMKRQASMSGDLAPALALSTSYAGISSGDVELMCRSISSGHMPAFALRSWAGGGQLAVLPPAVVAPLFDLLFATSSRMYAIGVELLGMYFFRQADRLESLRPQLKLMAANMKLAERHPYGSHMDQHHSTEAIRWLLNKGSDDRDAAAIALILAQHLADDPIELGKQYIRPHLPGLFSKFAHIVWPVIGQAIVSDKANQWRLRNVLGDAFAIDDEKQSLIAQLPADMLFAWCHAHPEVAPAFLAGIISVLKRDNSNGAPPQLDPLARRLLDEFGDREDVLAALNSNMYTFGWSGSVGDYYQQYIEPMRSLASHPIGAVRRWSNRVLVAMQREIDLARDENEERKASWGE